MLSSHLRSGESINYDGASQTSSHDSTRIQLKVCKGFRGGEPWKSSLKGVFKGGGSCELHLRKITRQWRWYLDGVFSFRRGRRVGWKGNNSSLPAAHTWRAALQMNNQCHKSFWLPRLKRLIIKPITAAFFSWTCGSRLEVQHWAKKAGVCPLTLGERTRGRNGVWRTADGDGLQFSGSSPTEI